MQRYQLRQDKLRPHIDGEWVRYADAKELEAITDAAWELRREAKDYNPCPDLGLRVTWRERLYGLLDEWARRLRKEATKGGDA